MEKHQHQESNILNQSPEFKLSLQEEKKKQRHQSLHLRIFHNLHYKVKYCINIT